MFVAGMGTGGTLMGTGRYLKEQKPACRVVGVEPTLGHTIQGLKNMHESIVPKVYDPDKLDEKIVVEDGEAFEMTRLLARQEGVFVGLSSGAAVAGALRVASRMTSGTIVVILPDRGDRYLSVVQFRSICAKCPPSKTADWLIGRLFSGSGYPKDRHAGLDPASGHPWIPAFAGMTEIRLFCRRSNRKERLRVGDYPSPHPISQSANPLISRSSRRCLRSFPWLP